jgi:glycyl-tRNA synthetase beta chain
LRARFTDARFFWDVDQKCRLADNLGKLAAVTFESRLGSYADKTQRLCDLASELAKQWSGMGIPGASVTAAVRAAELAKCDLVTEMVREFPELQGIVGGLYARTQGESEEVAWAVYDHYRPTGLEDPAPRNLAGCAVSLADKLDTLVGCFAIGIVPSGSSDPFALRRTALGIVKVLVEKRLPFSLAANVAAAAQSLERYPPKLKVPARVQRDALEFILERARFVFREQCGFAYDEVNAVMAAGSDDLVDALKRLEALRAIRRSKNFEPLAASFKRIRNILEKAGPAEHWRLPAVQPEKFVVEAERALYSAACQVARETEQLKRASQYREALSLIAGLRPLVDRFFADVLVMAEQEELRRNRLTLLSELLQEFSTIADFSELAVAKN